ncbi:MAG: RNA polymerase sigma factor [Planctomycetota bacterium]
MIYAIADPLPKSPTEAFVDRHSVPLWRYLRALGCESARAEEHCQDALLAALQNGLVDLDARDASRWLRTAAKNLFRMQLRAERRRPQAVALEALDAEWQRLHGEGRTSRANADDALMLLRACVEQLSPRQRQILEGHYSRRQSRRELAETHGVSEAGIKQTLRRLRLGLKNCIESRRRGSGDLDTEPQRKETR